MEKIIKKKLLYNELFVNAFNKRKINSHQYLSNLF